MKEEFVRFTLERDQPKSEGWKKESDFFSKDFEAQAPFLSQPLVLGEGSGVAGEEKPRQVGEVPMGGFPPVGPAPVGVFARERGSEAFRADVARGCERSSEVPFVSMVSSGVAGEEAARQGSVEQPHGVVEGPRVLEVDRVRKLKRGRRRR